MYDHIEYINQAIGVRMQWDLAAASFPHTSKSARKDIQKNVDHYTSFELDRGDEIPVKHQQYDEMPDEQRILTIGSALSSEGEAFLNRRRHHRKWLSEKGVSPDEALLRYTQWREQGDTLRASNQVAQPLGGDD